MHDLHNMFHFERKKIHAVFLLSLFVEICLPQCSFSFLVDFLTFFLEVLVFVTKCSILDVAGVLNSLQYAQHELHVQTNSYKCLTKDNWSLRVQCMTIKFDL